jgi:flagellin
MSITRINTNTDALLANANLSKIQFDMSRTLSHLSSGLRIVTGADDPAGMGQSTSYKAQLGGITQAIQNAQDGLSLMTTMDSALSGSLAILTRIRDIAVKASSGLIPDEGAVPDGTPVRAPMQKEVDDLTAELTKRKSSLTFNGAVLLDGSLNGTKLQVGPDNSAAMQITLVFNTVTNPTTKDVTLAAGALTTITDTQTAIDALALEQSSVGSQEKQLERVVNDLSAMHVNISAASSQITDADMATEVTDFARQQILAQAAGAMIAQANALPASIMKTLGIT